MTTPHKHAEVLRAIADGKRVEFRHPYTKDEWTRPESTNTLLGFLSYGNKYEFRIASDTMMIGRREVEKPSNGGQYRVHIWAEHTTDEDSVYRFSTKESMIAFRDALVEVAEG